MAGPSRLATVYAQDEDLAIRCDGDFAVLTPNSNLLASGDDGVFGMGNPWLLTSASNDFTVQGVAVGNIVKLTSVAQTPPAKPLLPWGASGGYFAVGVVAANALTLRRIGLSDGLGFPPSPPGGATAVKFAIETLGPQIEQASDDINRRFGIDPASSTRAPANLYDLRELQEATMLTVLLRKYTSDVRTKDGAYPVKIREITAQLDATLARLSIRWGPSADVPPAPSPKFGMRCSR